MKIKFLGAAGEVTGSSFMLERTDDTGKSFKILVDCGMHQGSNYCERENFEDFPYDPKEIKAVFITHAHIDHTGLLPKLYRQGFRGKIYSTPPTMDFARELLIDSEDILKREALREKKDVLYDKKDVENMMALWTPRTYENVVDESGFTVTFKNAGHILGSASYLIEADSRKVVFSGDLGNVTPTIIKSTERIDAQVDYCVMEATYGDRLHETHEASKEMLENVIEDTARAGGVLMIPAFAMERTQRLLFEINELTEQGRIPRAPVFIDSPLAIKLTEVYEKYRDYFNTEAEELVKAGDKLFKFPGLKFTETTEESKKINDVPAPKIVIAGSGMSNGGRILHHEVRYLSDPKSTILFIGYQAKGTMGRAILDGAKTVKIFGQEISVRCKVVNIGGYSAHADQNRLLEWLHSMRKTLKKVFLVHCEPASANEMILKIQDDLAILTVAPAVGDESVLE